MRYRRNVDVDLRKLERRYAETGDPSLLPAIYKAQYRITGLCFHPPELQDASNGIRQCLICDLRYPRYQTCPRCHGRGCFECEETGRIRTRLEQIFYHGKIQQENLDRFNVHDILVNIKVQYEWDRDAGEERCQGQLTPVAENVSLMRSLNELVLISYLQNAGLPLEVASPYLEDPVHRRVMLDYYQFCVFDEDDNYMGYIKIQVTPYQKFIYVNPPSLLDYIKWYTLTGRQYRGNEPVFDIDYKAIVEKAKEMITQELTTIVPHTEPERTRRGLSYWRWLAITYPGKDGSEYLWETGDGHLGQVTRIRELAAKEFLGLDKVYPLYFAY